jgi:hypothetical protein
VPAGQVRSTNTIRFKDVLTGATYEKTITTSNCGSKYCNVSMQIGSKDYYVQVYNKSTMTDSYVKVTWSDVSYFSGDTGATYGVPGYITFLPGIKAKNGEYIHFVNNYTKFNYGDVVILPGSNMFNTYTIPTSAASIGFIIGKIQYIYDFSTRTITPTALKNYSVGIMILEGKRFDGTKHAIYVGVDSIGTTVCGGTPSFRCVYNPEMGRCISLVCCDVHCTPVCGPGCSCSGCYRASSYKLHVAQPTFSDTTSTTGGSGGVNYIDWGSNSYISSAMDVYGALVTYDTKDQAKATITYPQQQLYTNIWLISLIETPICSGNVGLTISPNPVKVSSTVEVKINGVNCANYVFAKDSCYGVNPCLGMGCGAGPGTDVTCNCKFTSPNTAGNYKYYACLDKNKDGDYDEVGESDQKTLSVFRKTCTDSDGGKNYYTKGTVTVCTFYVDGGGCGAAVDQCSSDGTTLTEGYCDGTDGKSVKYECPNGCRNGVCIKTIQKNTYPSKGIWGQYRLLDLFSPLRQFISTIFSRKT